MRPSILILCLAFFASILLAQTKTNDSQPTLVTAGYTAKSGDIVESGMVGITGREITTADSLVKCHGDCEIRIHNIVFKADELDFHSKNAEVEARGNVRVKVLPQSTTH